MYNIYNIIYNECCGCHPNQNIFHDEWLCLKDINSDLIKYAHYIKGETLDVGCGSKPYAHWFPMANYIGLDLGDNPQADYLVGENQRYPFPDSYFDSIVSFQVFEHIRDIELAQSEINRVLKPHGIICLTVPFISYEHGAPSDYRRVTKHGIQHFFPNYEIIKVVPEGGFGSAVGTLLLRFIRVSMKRTRESRMLWVLLLPVWILLTAVINVFGWLFDKLDKTDDFYHNVLLLARKPE
jgi:SAM-dependent methyltransferase